MQTRLARAARAVPHTPVVRDVAAAARGGTRSAVGEDERRTGVGRSGPREELVRTVCDVFGELLLGALSPEAEKAMRTWPRARLDSAA